MNPRTDSRPGAEDSSPLRPIDFAILLVLSEGEHYGYGIVKAVAENDSGGVRLAPGNLYQVLDRLIARGWIEESRRREAGEGGRPRRFYRIKPAGVHVARAEGLRLKAMVPRLKRLGLYS